MAIIPQEKLKRKLPPLPGLSQTHSTATPPPPPLTTPLPVTGPNTTYPPSTSDPSPFVKPPTTTVPVKSWDQMSMWEKTKAFIKEIPSTVLDPNNYKVPQGKSWDELNAMQKISGVAQEIPHTIKDPNFLKTIPRTVYESEKEAAKIPIRFTYSAIQALKPGGDLGTGIKDIITGKSTPTKDDSLNLPIFGKISTYQNDFVPVADEVIEGKRPLWHALIPFVQVPLDAAFTGDLLNMGAKYILKKIPVNDEQVAVAINKMGLTDLSPEAQSIQYRKLAHEFHPDLAGEKSTKLMSELNQANDILEKAREQGTLVSNPTGLAKAMRDLAEKGVAPAGDLFKMKEAAPYLNVKGLLPEQAGTIPEPTYKPFRQPAFGLSIKEVGGKPIVPAQSEPLQRALASFQKNLYMQVGHYTKEGESIIKGLDLSTVASVDEAANLAIASLPPEIAKDPVIIDSVNNWKNSAKQIQQFREETVKPISSAIKKAANYNSPGELRNAIDSIIEKGKAFMAQTGKSATEFNKEKFAKTLSPKDRALYESGKDLPGNIDLVKVWNQTHKGSTMSEPITFYRGGGIGSMPKGKTAEDVINYEKQDLGNEIKIEPGINPKEIKSEDLAWVTTTKEAAKEYGAVSQVPFDNYRIIARDNYNGVLVEKLPEIAQKPIVQVTDLEEIADILSKEYGGKIPLYHATTVENAKKIISEGLQTTQGKNYKHWGDEDQVYFQIGKSDYESPERPIVFKTEVDKDWFLKNASADMDGVSTTEKEILDKTGVDISELDSDTRDLIQAYYNNGQKFEGLELLVRNPEGGNLTIKNIQQVAGPQITSTKNISSAIKKINKGTQKRAVAEAIKETPKSIKEIAEETKILEPNVRRILGVGAKEGVFSRIEKGVYVLSKDGQDIAYINPGDAVMELPKLAKQGFKADMIFLDIPYKTPAITGGNRGAKFGTISVDEFTNVAVAVADIARNDRTPIIYMYSQAKSGLKAMEKYNNVMTDYIGFKPVARGEYTKLQKDGITRTRNMRGEPDYPEGIIVFSMSGKIDKTIPNLNFRLVRPKGYQTEKPAEMLKKLIEMTTNEGEMVLDPFAGSGVTIEQAIKTGRKGYAIEKSPEAVKEYIIPRIKKALEERKGFPSLEQMQADLQKTIKEKGATVNYTPGVGMIIEPGKSVSPVTTTKQKEIAKLIKVLSKPPKTPPVTPSSINKMINPPSPLVTKSEDFLLRKKMKDMKRGNVLGYQAGTTDTRIRIYDKLRTKMTEMKDVKDQIIGYVKETIPPKDRGRFLNMVANAKTQRNLIKSFVRIDKVAEAVQKKIAVSELTKKLKDIENSGKISVEYKPIIKKMVEDIELKGHTSGKIEELKATREFIEREIAKGNDVTMPQYVLDSLKILDRKPLKDLSLSELQVISDKIDVLRQLGETKLASKENLDNLIKEKWTKELSQGTFPLEKNPLLSPKLRHLTLWEKVKNSIARGRNAKIDIDYALTDPEVLADMLDGNAHYLGPNYRIFFKPQSINYGNYLQGRVNFHDTVIGLLKKNGINDVDLFGERLFIELNKHQKGGIEKLLENGYSQAQIDSVNLTPGETNIYNFVREYYDNAGKRAESFIQKTYNKEFKLQENYSPWWTDYKAMSESIDPATGKAPQVWERFANPIEYRPPKKTVEFGWMKSRTGGKNIIKHNAVEDLLKHNDDLEYMTNMGADTKRLFEVANSPAYAEMAGKEGQSRMITWLNSIARKGGSIGETQTGWIDAARGAVGAGSMAFKLSTVLIQFTSLFDAATQIGPWAFKGMFRFATSKEARDFLYKNAPEWKARFGKEYAMSEFSTNKLLAKYQQMGYKPMAKADSFTAGSALLGAYEKYLVEHGLPIDFTTVNKDAMYEAQRIMRRTQGTGEFIYQPPEIVHGVLTKNRSLSKAIWQFQSFNLTGRWNYIKHDLWVYGIKEKDPKVAVNMLFWLTVAAFAGVGMRQMAKRATGGEPNPDDTLTSSTAQELLQTIPFVSMITSMGKFKGEPVPILDIPRQIFTATDQIGGKTPETKRKGYIKLAEILGKASGVPGASQAGEIARNLTGVSSPIKKSSSLPTLPGLKKSTKTKKKGLPKLKKIKR